MEHLNIQQIERKLNLEFSNGTRIVFWYDADGSFEDTVDGLNLGDVIIHHLTENNAFRTKLLLEHEDTEHCFLVYAPFEKPDVSRNHLEDTLRYSKEFYADKLSLIAADIRLPDRLRPAFKRLGKFFGIGVKKERSVDARCNRFIEQAKEMDLLAAEEEDLYTLAMCVLAKARNVTFDDLLYAVFDYGDLKEQKIISEFARMDLAEIFWEMCRSRFGFSEPQPTLWKLAVALFVTYTVREFREPIPKQWKNYVLERTSNVNVLIDNMMNSVVYWEAYDKVFGNVAKELEAEQVLRKIPLENLLECASCCEVDRILIRWTIDRELDENKTASISGKKIPEICEMREKQHFGTTFRWEYRTLYYAHKLLFAVGYESQNEFGKMIDEYCRNDFLFDTAYRHFIYAYDQMEDAAEFEALKERVENIYITEYLEKIVYSWNVAYRKNAMRRVILPQKYFYQEKVEKVKEKVAVIISDGLRYEVAMQLLDKLQQDQNCTAAMDVMMGCMPSYTALGMANLLPHDEVSMREDYTVLVDGKICRETVQREKILQGANENSAAIDYKSIREMKASQLKQFSAKKEVIYIYHNKIDDAGEGKRTEHSVFKACEEAVNELFALVKWLSKSGNVYRFLVTADHGFLYTRKKMEESDKLDNLSSANAFRDRRFIIDDRDLETDGAYSLKLGDCLSGEDSRFVRLPKGVSVFRTGGGMNYVHGGSSPQELLLPSIFIKTEKGIVEIEDVRVAVVTNVSKITNLFTTVDIFQEEPVNDVRKEVTYRIHFEAENGELISNEVIFNADSREEDPRKRIFRLKFDIKRRTYSDEKKYFLKIIKDPAGAESYSRQIIMDLPYMDWKRGS